MKQFLKLLWNCLAAVCIGVVAWLVAGDVVEAVRPHKKVVINTKGKTK